MEVTAGEMSKVTASGSPLNESGRLAIAASSRKATRALEYLTHDRCNQPM